MYISNLVFIVMQNGADKPRLDILSRRLLGDFTCHNFYPFDRKQRRSNAALSTPIERYA